MFGSGNFNSRSSGLRLRRATANASRVPWAPRIRVPWAPRIEYQTGVLNGCGLDGLVLGGVPQLVAVPSRFGLSEGRRRPCGWNVGPGSRHDSYGQVITEAAAQESERTGEHGGDRVPNLFRLPGVHPRAEPLEPPARRGSGPYSLEKGRFDAGVVQCSREDQRKAGRANRRLQARGNLSADDFGPQDHLPHAGPWAGLVLEELLRKRPDLR